MQVHIIPALPRWGVVITGGIDAARDAVAHWVGSRPLHNPVLHNPVLNGYGAVHTDVWATEEQLQAWFRAGSVWPRPPGTLTFYLRKS